MKTVEEIRDLIEKIKVTNFGSPYGTNVITIESAKELLIKNLKWVLEEENEQL